MTYNLTLSSIKKANLEIQNMNVSKFMKFPSQLLCSQVNIDVSKLKEMFPSQ